MKKWILPLGAKKLNLKTEKCYFTLEEFPLTEDIQLKHSINKLFNEFTNNIYDYDNKQPIKKYIEHISDINLLTKLEKLYQSAQKFHEIKNLKMSQIFFNELENKIPGIIPKFEYLENRMTDMKKILYKTSIKHINNIFFEKFLSLLKMEMN